MDPHACLLVFTNDLYSKHVLDELAELVEVLVTQEKFIDAEKLVGHLVPDLFFRFHPAGNPVDPRSHVPGGNVFDEIRRERQRSPTLGRLITEFPHHEVSKIKVGL